MEKSLILRLQFSHYTQEVGLVAWECFCLLPVIPVNYIKRTSSDIKVMTEVNAYISNHDETIEVSSD